VLQADVARHGRVARDVAAGVRQALRETHAHRVLADGEYDRNGGREPPHDLHCLRMDGDDDVRFHAHQLVCVCREALGVPVREAPFDGNRLPFDVAEVAQAGHESVEA